MAGTFTTSEPDVFCIYPFTKVRTDSLGNVFFCCFQRSNPIGNLLESEFNEIWFGEAAERVRVATQEGRLDKMCDIEACPHQYQMRYSAKKQNLGLPYPQLLEIDLPNTHCNFGGAKPSPKNPACLMCERSLPDFEFQQEHRLMDVLPKLMPLLPFIRNIHIQGTAEPFWKDALFDVLNKLDFEKHSQQIQISTVTNGSVFDTEKQKLFLSRIEKSTVAFSVDAATRETYNRIRRHDVFDTVVKNIVAFKKNRKQRKEAFFRVYHNINLLNLHEVEAMVDMAAEWEVDVLEFNPTWGQPTEILVNRKNADRFLEAENRIRTRARALALRVQFLRPLDLNLSRHGDREEPHSLSQ